jgi:hypothetical protein
MFTTENIQAELIRSGRESSEASEIANWLTNNLYYLDEISQNLTEFSKTGLLLTSNEFSDVVVDISSLMSSSAYKGFSQYIAVESLAKDVLFSKSFHDEPVKQTFAIDSQATVLETAKWVASTMQAIRDSKSLAEIIQHYSQVISYLLVLFAQFFESYSYLISLARAKQK